MPRASTRKQSSRPSARAPSPRAASTARLNGISSDAVLKATGKSWSQWLTTLDKAGAKGKPHKEIVAILADRHRVGPWWRQMVTVGYEQARRKRVRHQRPGGDTFSASASKVIGVPVAALFRAWTDPHTLRRWLPGHAFTIRRATIRKSLRVTWSDGKTHVEANFTAKGKARSHVAVEHAKLASAAQAKKLQAFWRARLAALKQHLES